jgi:polyvinyl alcohol dehydrogenase (cytochrome)
MILRPSTIAVVLSAFAGHANAQDGAALYAQHCAECHEGGVRAPSRQVLSALSRERIVSALDTGLMRVQGEGLTAAERAALAAYLSAVGTAADTRPYAGAKRVRPPCGRATGRPGA